MYQLLLTNAPQTASNGQSVVDSILAMLGMSLLISILIPLMFFLFFVIILTLLGILTQSIAGKKGYNRFGFFWYGFFFFPIAVGVAILAPPLNNDFSKANNDEEEIAEYEKMYEAGTLSYTQLCQKKEEIQRRKYYN